MGIGLCSVAAGNRLQIVACALRNHLTNWITEIGLFKEVSRNPTNKD